MDPFQVCRLFLKEASGSSSVEENQFRPLVTTLHTRIKAGILNRITLKALEILILKF